MPADSAASARALAHTRALAHEHDGPQGLPDMVPLKLVGKGRLVIKLIIDTHDSSGWRLDKRDKTLVG